MQGGNDGPGRKEHVEADGDVQQDEQQRVDHRQHALVAQLRAHLRANELHPFEQLLRGGVAYVEATGQHLGDVVGEALQVHRVFGPIFALAAGDLSDAQTELFELGFERALRNRRGKAHPHRLAALGKRHVAQLVAAAGQGLQRRLHPALRLGIQRAAGFAH